MASPSYLQFSSPPDSITTPAEMPMSPDLLAAVGNVIIGVKIAPHHRAILLSDPHHGCLPINGLTKNSATSLRTFKVLDALASLSVSRPKSQVVSIGLQIDTNNITLTIAENDPIAVETIQYVGNTWRMLRELSQIYADERNGHPNTNWQHWAGLSPPVPRFLSAADNLIAQLAAHVYTFTVEKFWRRLNRWWPKLRTFTNQFITAKKHKLNREESLLRDSVLAFRMGLDTLGVGDKCRSVRWSDVVRLMDTAAKNASELLADKYGLESWVHAMQSTFPLRRALEKVTSHHRYFTELVGFAHSPRLHRFFSLVPTIATVPDCFDDIPRHTLPDGEGSWHAIVTGICVDTPVLIGEVVAKLQKNLSGEDQDPCVHSECALVAHYEVNRGKGLKPPFSYMGVSKLSCMPCYLWLKAVSQQTGRNYYTRGTHGKWCRGWRAPNLGPDPAAWDAGETKILEGSMAGVLRERLREENHGVRNGSDSTDASGDTMYVASEKHEAEVKEMLSEGIGKEI